MEAETFPSHLRLESRIKKTSLRQLNQMLHNQWVITSHARVVGGEIFVEKLSLSFFGIDSKIE